MFPAKVRTDACIEKAIDFVLRCQQADGLLAYSGGGGRSTSGKTANYNHAIAGLMLTEVYGMTDRARAARLKPAIVNAVEIHAPRPGEAQGISGRPGRLALLVFGNLRRLRPLGHGSGN